MLNLSKKWVENYWELKKREKFNKELFFSVNFASIFFVFIKKITIIILGKTR